MAGVCVSLLGFLSIWGTHMCACIDTCLSTCVCSQLKCVASSISDWQMQSGASFSDNSFILK